ncbi:MAG TPA: hypothetical protein VFQ65_20225, partial [Kofleriaceae bacterium]|nr:hypothetical protein [Kofleriaceae bacterium]
VQNETGGGAEAKLSGSDGDSADARANLGASGGYEKLVLTGREEIPNDKGTTLRLMFGDRTSRNAGINGGFGTAGGTATVGDMKQGTTTYVFSIPKDQQALLDQARAIDSEAAAKEFANNHKDLVGPTVKGDIAQDTAGVGMNVGPLALAGSTTSTVDGNVAHGKKTVTDPDGSTHNKETLSGTQDGTRDDKASLSLLGVKIAQGQTTTTSHGNVDDNGQASLDLTTSSSSSNAASAIPANLKANDKTDLAAAAATGGGPMGLVKKLAERVGEQSTVGAHFDDAAFHQLINIATNDSVQWSRAITTQYRAEWFTLQHNLAHPNPPKEWTDHDDSEGHIAAKTLAQMKAFATFVSVSGAAGQTAISRVRGEYSANAIGETVSWPPSLQDQRPIFDGLAKSVEHLKPTLAPYAEAGDAVGGNALLDKLTADLGAMRTKIENAPDHENATLALRAANGIGDMQLTVTTYKDRFANAIAAFQAKKPAAEIDAELDAKVVKSTQMIATSNAASDQAWRAKQAAAQMTPPADNAPAATWTAYNKQFAAAVKTETDAKQAADQARAAENKQRADEAAETAKKNIPDFEQRCLNAKGHAWSTLDQAVGALPGWTGSSDDTRDKLLSLGNQMKQWSQDWNALHGYYTDAGMPDGYRTHLKPGLRKAPFQTISDNTHLSDNWKGYAGELRNQWATIA